MLNRNSLVNSLIKQPAERFYVGIDFSELLSAGESISTPDIQVKAYCITDGMVDVTGSLIDPSTLIVNGDVVQLQLKDGEAGKRYKISFTVPTSLGNIYEEDIFVLVED